MSHYPNVVDVAKILLFRVNGRSYCVKAVLEGIEIIECQLFLQGDPGAPCSPECLGGCSGPLPTQCTACTNMRWTGEGCKEKCPGLPWLSVGPTTDTEREGFQIYGLYGSNSHR
jgi:hypothetical protein